MTGYHHKQPPPPPNATRNVNTTRRHHYFSQGFLAGFTASGTKEGQFWVTEVETGNGFPTSPQNVGVVRDFNRIDVEGQRIDALESALSAFEGDAIKTIRNILVNRAFPDASELNIILNFVGLVAVRNPRSRANFNAAREQTLNVISDLLISDRRFFETQVRKAAEAGFISDTNVSFYDLKKFIEERRYTIEFHPQENSRMEFEAFDKLLPILGQRTWSIFLVPLGGPEFICSDHPVTLISKSGQASPIGFESRETEVFVPLGRHVGLYGTFENPIPPVVTLRAEAIAAMNTRSTANSERYVFSCLKKFTIKQDGIVREVECISNCRT